MDGQTTGPRALFWTDGDLEEIRANVLLEVWGVVYPHLDPIEYKPLIYSNLAGAIGRGLSNLQKRAQLVEDSQ